MKSEKLDEGFLWLEFRQFCVGRRLDNNILWRLESGELEGLRPKVVVVLAGTSNSSSSPSRAEATNIAHGIKAITDTCQRKVPSERITVTAIFRETTVVKCYPLSDGSIS